MAVMQCARCEHLYLKNWEKTLSLPLYDYYSSRLDWPADALFEELNTLRFAELLGQFATRCEGRRLLDVGCGLGQLVKVAGDRGWDSLGIDQSSTAVQIANRLGANVERRDFFSEELDGRRFDVIVMTELVEHVARPRDFLERAFRMLAPGGLFYVTTPNFDSLTRRVVGGAWDPIHPQHVSYFVTETLVRCVREAGFRLREVGSRNTSPGVMRQALQRRWRTHEEPAAEPVAATFSAGDTQRLRRAIRGSKALTLLLDWTNRALSVAHAGDTLVVWATKPHTASV